MVVIVAVVWLLLRRRGERVKAAAESRAASEAEGGRATVNLGGIYLTLDGSFLSALRDAGQVVERPEVVQPMQCLGCGLPLRRGGTLCEACGQEAMWAARSSRAVGDGVYRGGS
jgi:hypothetical protein